MIVGGVSVLGTEFEGPKRVMKSARDSLERAVGRDTIEGEKPVEGDTRPSTPETESTVEEELAESDKAQPPADTNSKPTMGDRFKNFGRRHILPFLDQVVGDRNEVHKDNSPAHESMTEGSPTVDDSNKIDVAAPDETLEEATTSDKEELRKVESTLS